ncbi:DUF4351 domain-containing protein [Bacillus luti]|nr:transposase [Bacillus cereus]
MSKEFENLGHDRMFKNLLELFLPDYLNSFYPGFYQEIDWNKPIKLLTETTDHSRVNIKANEPRYVDVLFEVYLNGEDIATLLHFENQSYAQTIFPRRVYEYNCLIRSNHPNQSVYSFTICFGTYPHTGERNKYEYNTVNGLQKNVFYFNEINLKNIHWQEPSLNNNPITWALAPLMKKNRDEENYDIMVSCLQKVVESYYTIKTDKACRITLFLDYYFQPEDSEIEKAILEIKDTIKGRDVEIMNTVVATPLRQGSQLRAKHTMLKTAVQAKFYGEEPIPAETLNIIESISDNSKPENLLFELMQINDNDTNKKDKLNTCLSKYTI